MKTITKQYCKRCPRGKKGWYPRKPGRPRICPYCKHPKFDTPKRKRTKWHREYIKKPEQNTVTVVQKFE